MDIKAFFEKVAAGFSFEEIGAWFKDLFASVTAEGGPVETYWTMGLDFIKGLLPLAWILPAILIALSLVQVFAGKKLLGLQKFLACFVVGYALGAVLLTPVIAEFVQIADWIVGLVVGVVAALLCKPIYFLSYVAVAGYGVYALCMSDVLPEAVASFTNNWIVALVAAVVAVVVALLLRKWIEMLGTAALGAWTLFLSVQALLASLSIWFAAEYVIWWELGTLAVGAILGFIVQVKTRSY